MKCVAFAVAALAVVFFVALSSAVAAADPVAPQSDSPCASHYTDAMTLPSGATMPLVCQGGQWHAVTTPQPPSDLWLSYGPALALHGEGKRNPNLRSGEWTATPQDSSSQCRAQQSVVLSPGIVGAPQTTQGQPGRPLEVTVLPRLFDIALSGNCLWQRND